MPKATVRRGNSEKAPRYETKEKKAFSLQKELYAAAALLVITFAIYAPALNSGFIWDDDAMLTENRLIRSTTGLFKFWFSTEPPDYFPLVSTLLWLQWRTWGMNPMGYHFVQILLHALNCILLWRVARQLRVPGAWWAGLLYAVHPVAVETVAWITETKNTLPMALLLASLLWYLKHEQEPAARKYLASIGLFVLALLGKTSVVMLPVVLLIIAWWKRGAIARTDLKRSAPFFAASLVLGLVTVWFQLNRAIVHTVIREDSFPSRLAIAGKAVWFYLLKAFLPLNLSFVYPKWDMNPSSPAAYVFVVLLIVLFAALLVFRNRIGRGPAAALAIYVVNLLPVLGFVNIYFMRYSYVADHWQYVSLGAFCVFCSGAIAHARGHLPSRLAKAVSCLAVLVITAMALGSRIYTPVFKSNESLFRDVVKKNPKAWIAHNNLGIVLAQRGQLDLAMKHYEQALALKPDLADAHLNVGNIYAVRKRDDLAEQAYRRALKLTPYFRTFNALGEVYLRQNKLDEAIRNFQLSLNQSPDFWLAHRNLGESYDKLGRLDAAAAAYGNAIRFRPGDPELQNQLAHVLSRSGKPDEAIAQLQKTVAVFPGYQAGYRNLAALLVRRGRHREAMELLRKAVSANPDNRQLQAELRKLEERSAR